MTIVTNWESAIVLVFLCIFGTVSVLAWHDERDSKRKHEKEMKQKE